MPFNNTINIIFNGRRKAPRIIYISPPKTGGGVKVMVDKLERALTREGLNVVKLTIGNNVVDYIMSAQPLRRFTDGDVLLFLGSIPPLSHVFLPKPKLLFVHGFMYHEVAATLRYGSIRAKIGGLLSLPSFEIARSLNTVDSFICTCMTTCEMAKIRNFILLPEFIFPEDLEEAKRYTSGGSSSNGFTVVAYTSLAMSPRLLDKFSIISIWKAVAKKAHAGIRLILVNPHSRPGVAVYGNLRVEQREAMPREKFLGILANSDLYFEGCIDEELRVSSIDAGIVGTPVAKLTHPQYRERQDYDEDEIVVEYGVNRLIDRLADYVRYRDYYKDYFSKSIKKFLLSKRNWDYVKRDFINKLKDMV